jgi:predicted nucleic acid-binding protein
LCIETAPYIYFVEKQPIYGPKMRAVFEQVEIQGIEVVSSVLTLTEVLVKPLRESDTQLELNYRELLTTTDLIHLLPVSVPIANRAADLRARYNLKTPDAVHIATAIEHGSDAFLTNDKALARITEVRVIVLDDLELDNPAND